MWEPKAIGLHEQLPESDLGRCRTPRCHLGWLYYQRQDTEEGGYPKHFFFCRRCGQRYAAWESWTPGTTPVE